MWNEYLVELQLWLSQIISVIDKLPGLPTNYIPYTRLNALKHTLFNVLYLCHTGECTSSCLNGGWCVHLDSCNCTLYQATGTHCQTVPNLGFEREMTCRSWGQYNYETFDGLYYYFPGKCSYTLLRDCEDSTRSSVHIQVHNDPECSSFPYSCTRSISLFLPWEGEIRLQNFSVIFKGQSVQLPHHIHDVELERISDYIVVSQPQGFTLAWQGLTGSVYIKMSPEFVGHTCGLCGNFNADTQDDLKTSYGVFKQDLAMFGNSWAEEEPQLGGCPVVPSLYPSPCDSGSSLQKVEEVCATLLKEPFQSCHEFVSPYSYMASCSNDLCLSGPNGDVVCQVFTEYARACAHAGHALHNWRAHFPVCVDCPGELFFRECITCCPMHCKIEHMCIDSKLQCLDGCYCPDGNLIYENGVCVKASECPCEHHGMLYPSGLVIQEDCNNCTCVGGIWNCTEHNCPGECSVTGDMFFQSFDGHVYTFPATCQYVLAKSRNSGKFTVTIQNAPCGANLDGACIQSVNLMVDEDPHTEITMSHSGEVFLASQFRISLDVFSDVLQIQELSSMFVQVKSSQGLRLQYNWREFRLYLQLEKQWRDDTVGLCGTFNGNIQDDFLAPSGMIESTPYLFGNAWRVSSACVPRPILLQLDPCDTHQQAAAYAVEKCDVLMQEVFSACHEYVSPVGFQLQCRADVCKCGAPCLCSILAHYARTCRRHGVIIEFRSHLPECAITCPSTMEYGVCVSSCQRRCLFLSLPQLCGDECEEGCVCPEGTYFNMHTHTCVPRSECPCSFLGADYSPGDVVMTSSGVHAGVQCIFSFSPLLDTMCPPGQFYEDCGNRPDGHSANKGLACEQTCESYLLNLTCSTHEPCMPGCVCPTGLLEHGDECFEPHACPCLWKGKEYYPGDRVSSPCHQCVCQHGTFQCEFRPCPSMCTAYGDRHYRTFDGFLFDYIGACKVYLVKSSLDSMMTVTAENVDCFESGVICRKSLLISLGRSFIVFDDDTGKPVSELFSFLQKVYIWQAGYYTIVHLLGEDLTVLWDRKTTVHIQAGPRWQGKLAGLCGNFDQKTANEMRTPENIDSSTPQEFGNSWTAAEACPDIRHPCNLNPLREPFAKRQCGILLSEVFQVCHPVVDVTWFYMNCLVDTCGCNRGGDCECFCTSVAAYAHRCCQKGVTIDWRSPSVCPLGKGPLKLLTYRERGTLLAANKTSGLVFPKREMTSTDEILMLFMMTPGISKYVVNAADTSLVSFEAADRPNYYLKAERSGQLRLQKWEETEAFWDAATFVLHRDTWISGFDSLESLAKPGFFLHFMLSRLQLMKYSHSDRYQISLFSPQIITFTTGAIPHYPMGPRCQWRYESCVSPCFRTCSDPSGLSCASILKVEGCLPQCPSHMVLDEVTHRCVFMEDCKLLFLLLLLLMLSPYSEVVDECTKLICVSGQLLLFNKSQSCPYDATPPNCGLLGFAVLVNGDKCCPRWDCPCRCSVFPDLNLITFDGKSVAIYKARRVSIHLFAILGINCHFCSGNRLQKREVQKYNGLFFQLYVNSRYAKPRFKKFGFEILDTGNMYLIRSPAGLKIQWFHTTGLMVIEMDSYNNRLPTVGLCGSCDGNPLNDLTLSNGTVVSEQEDPAVFIDSWQIPNTTSYVSHSRRREVNCTTGDCSQCMSMLSNRTFTICHPYVPPAMFCEMWVRDVEYVNNPCVALAAYAASCHKFNICMEWRSSDFCPFMCPENLQYQACLPACTAPSCPNQEFEFVPEQCTGLSEGCVCPEGTLLHRPYSALCIPPSKCACTDSFGTPRTLKEVWKASLDGCCMYKCENDGIVPVEYNCSNIPQPVCMRTGEITVSLADDSSCCPHKACGLMCEAAPTDCKYGEKLVSYYRQDSCCPEYSCECDPDQCVSDIPVCHEDQTLIATRAEGSCCLAHICMCDKCSEAAPVCQDGELLIVDTNSTERCCPVYHCCEYKHMIKHTDMREAVCVDGERGVMQPGQTLVEHRDQGVCYTTQCTHTLDSATGFYLLKATGTNCTVRCQPVTLCSYRVCSAPGRSWVSDCMHYDCTDALSGPVLVSHPYSCPPFNETECMKDEKDHSLTSHAVGKEDGKSCQKVTVRMTIRKNDCRSNRPVNIVSCDGKCPSASIYNYNINTYARFCKCCREMGLQRRSVQLYCSGNSTWVNYTIQEPTDCSCQWS
uniref:Otogelin-like n=1 Tax=Sinocyclocheilus anshuiensis TaxID=1608454 RepID=A0A671S0L1_9TELE